MFRVSWKLKHSSLVGSISSFGSQQDNANKPNSAFSSMINRLGRNVHSTWNLCEISAAPIMSQKPYVVQSNGGEHVVHDFMGP